MGMGDVRYTVFVSSVGRVYELYVESALAPDGVACVGRAPSMPGRWLRVESSPLEAHCIVRDLTLLQNLAV